MKINSAEELFQYLVSLTNSAEKQMTRSLPKMARAAENPDLKKAFEDHLDETQGQLDRLEKAMDTVSGIRIKRIKDHAMATLIEEGEELVDGTDPGAVRDAGLIGAAQKIEHYEIATYGTLCALADQLGYQEAKEILAETLKEEKSADDKLTGLAEKQVNPASD